MTTGGEPVSDHFSAYRSSRKSDWTLVPFLHRAAALAGLGQGRDAGNLSNEARAALRRQALDWLKADLAAWRSHSDESQRARVLQNWRADKALAGVRDEERLAKLPQAHRAAWRGLWAEVEKLLKQAR
jgi:hypothetical protein